MLSQFKNIHKGETFLIVGNGENLKLTPPELFNYPSFGVNEIHLYENWTPAYYTAVDKKNFREYGDKILSQYKHIPKFLPSPRFLAYQGEKIYFFKGGQGMVWPKNGKELWQENFSTSMIYGNIMHVAIKLAYYMGAKNILIIGMEHKKGNAHKHFWGRNDKMSPDQPIDGWLKGYKYLAKRLAEKRVKLINISEKTYVPKSIIPTDNYKNWLDEVKEK